MTGHCSVTGVLIQTHTLMYTHAHINTSYAHASMPSNKAERGQWGLMLLQFEHLTKFPLFSSSSHNFHQMSILPLFTFSDSLLVHFHRHFSGDLLYILLFWVVCVIELGNDEKWRHFGFIGQKKQLMASTTTQWIKDWRTVAPASLFLHMPV